MFDTVKILIEQIAMMFILMAIGYMLFKVKCLEEVGVQQISKLILYVINPILVFQSIVEEYSKMKIIKGFYATILSILIILIGIVISKLIYKKKDGLCQFAVSFSNVGFLGIPLIYNVLGSEYVFYISIFSAVTSVLIWTYGMKLVTGKKEFMNIGKALKNPCIMMLFVGIICLGLNLRLPPIINTSLTTLSDCNTGLVMLVLGSYLAQSNLMKSLLNRKVILTCCLRLLIVPLITLICLDLLPTYLNDLKLTLIIGASTPVAALLAIFSKTFSNEKDFGIGIVAISTIFSLFTMPLFVILAQNI